MGQRPINLAHVQSLKNGFEGGIKRVLPGNRLYVSMTKKVFQTCVDATAKASGQDPSVVETAVCRGKGEGNILYSDLKAVPRLLIPVADGKISQREVVQVEAGQHRTEAMLMYANEFGGSQVTPSQEIIGGALTTDDDAALEVRASGEKPSFLPC